MLVHCLNCNTEFEKSPANIRRSSNHFCGRSCAVVYNNTKVPKRTPEGHCRICQTPITTNRTWCSNTCRSQSRTAAQQRRLVNRGPRVVAWRQRVKLKGVAYKGGACQVCNYSKAIRALAFHHLDPTQKDFGIGDGAGRSWKSIRAELNKCVLLCSNCHAEVHSGLLDVAHLGSGGGNRTPADGGYPCPQVSLGRGSSHHPQSGVPGAVGLIA